MPDHLRVMARAASVMRHSDLYVASSEINYLRVESSWTSSYRGLALIGPCCADAEQIMLLFRVSPLSSTST